MADLFTYGTLMFDDVFRAVARCDLAQRSATAEGFARCALRGRVYPGLIAKPNATVHGELYENLPPDALRAIIAFERPQYRIETIPITFLDTGEARDALVFLLTVAHHANRLPTAWDADQFQQAHLADYVRGCIQWRRSYDRLAQA